MLRRSFLGGIMAALTSAWMVDRAAGAGKVIYATPATPSSAIGLGGIVGQGNTGTPPNSGGYAPLMPAGTILPAPGDPNRAKFFLAMTAAVGFDGKTNIAGTPSATVSRKWSLSCWLNFGVNNVVGFHPLAANGSSVGGAGTTDGSIFCGNGASDNDIRLQPYDDTANPFLAGAEIQTATNGNKVTADFTYPGDGTTGAGWVHFMAALFSTSTTERAIVVVNDTVIFDQTTTGSGNVAYAFNTGFAQIGGIVSGGTQSSSPTDGHGLYAAMTEYWEAPGQFIDWTIRANRYLFHTSDDGWGPSHTTWAPVNLGPAGALPTGKKPRCYLTGPPPLFPLNRAASGASLTVQGDALVTIDDPPI